MLCPSASGEEVAGSRDVDAFFEGRVMSVGNQPLPGRVVLHVSQLVLEIDPDGQLAQSLGFFRG